MLQYWRVLIFLIMIMASIFAIGLKQFPYGREGVEVVYIATDSPVKGVVEQGDVITELNGQQVRGQEDWDRRTAEVQGNLTLLASGRAVKSQANGSLGLNVVGIERTNLEFGLDLRGGTRIILKPEGNVTEATVEETLGILETRANLFGLREIKFVKVRDLGGDWFIQVEAAGVGNEIVEELLSRTGEFEAKVIKPVDLREGIIQLGQERVLLQAEGNGSIRVNGTVLLPNQTLQLKGIPFEYLNRSGDRVLFLATVFGGEDIELVQTDPQSSGIIPRGDVYEFFFTVLISQDGAQRFADVTTGIPRYVDVNSGEEYLDSALLLLIDGEVVSSLRISGNLGGQVIQSPQITGAERTQEEAVGEKLRLQTILRSGALPVSLSTLSVDSISPTLGTGFFAAAGLAIALSAGVVFALVFSRYRRLRVTLPLALVGISEALIIAGVAAANDAAIWVTVFILNACIVTLAWIKKQEIDLYAVGGALLVPLIGMISWTIDLPAVAGIIAVMGTGVNHTIIIADEVLAGARKVYGIREQLKAAFFIIMGAAGTTIAALLPLMFIGIGLVRGFAITSIVGVLIGILITRPAYAKIVERVVAGRGSAEAATS